MTLMPLLMIEERTRSLGYFLLDVSAVTEDAGRKAFDESWEESIDM